LAGTRLSEQPIQIGRRLLTRKGGKEIGVFPVNFFRPLAIVFKKGIERMHGGQAWRKSGGAASPEIVFLSFSRVVSA
jgi:hypothetical protein